jgi:hypothetical protein
MTLKARKAREDGEDGEQMRAWMLAGSLGEESAGRGATLGAGRGGYKDGGMWHGLWR